MAKYNGRDVVVNLPAGHSKEMVTVTYTGAHANLGTDKVPLSDVKLTSDERKLVLEQLHKELADKEAEFKKQDEEEAKAKNKA